MSNEPGPEKTAEAAREFVSPALDKLADERGVHAETVIAGVARMAGTFLYRSFGFQLTDAKPGQPVLSEMANERGPRLVDIVTEALAAVGIHLDFKKVTEESRNGHGPIFSFLDTQKRLEPAFNQVGEQLGLSLSRSADAAALATALRIQQTRDVLDANIAFDIAVYGFIEGTKTVPAAI